MTDDDFVQALALEHQQPLNPLTLASCLDLLERLINLDDQFNSTQEIQLKQPGEKLAFRQLRSVYRLTRQNALNYVYDVQSGKKSSTQKTKLEE